MNGELAQRVTCESQLTSNDERFRLASASGRMGVWELNFERGAQLVLSHELKALFGFKSAEFDGRLAGLLRRVYFPDRKRVLRSVVQALRRQQELEVEFRIDSEGQDLSWLLARGRPCRVVEGGLTKWVGACVEITAQKSAEDALLRLNLDLERRMTERTMQLQVANHELEAFCYSVSHDLRAPLRSIRGFNEVLLDRYAADLDPRALEFLRRACESSRHMDELIDDLLKLSRVGRAELGRQMVNLSELVQTIANGLRDAEPHRMACFEITPDLHASGDEHLLRIMLENLLQNAWKFTSKRPEARIEFGLATMPERAFFVRDNGAGFDPAYGGRLFAAFQRLHSASEFGGTGIGLATVQRIINRHGGRVWAQGAVDQGATFYFALPCDEVF